jgi:hypothetical protein
MQALPVIYWQWHIRHIQLDLIPLDPPMEPRLMIHHVTDIAISNPSWLSSALDFCLH